jgi:DNA-binding transcriptional LysR family regulator
MPSCALPGAAGRLTASPDRPHHERLTASCRPPRLQNNNELRCIGAAARTKNMKNMNVVDTKLLVVFDAVMRERSLTRAAQHVGMSAPAVSLVLKRLRYLLDDRLFVRIPGGVNPTPRALELAEPVRDVLQRLQTVFEPKEFSPEKATQTIRVASSNQCAVLVLPKLHERLRAHAPGISLLVRPNRYQTCIQQLDEGEIHLALGIMLDIPQRIPHVPLYRDKFVCVMRADHPLAGKRLTAKDYLAADHISMSNQGETAYLLDKVLEKRGVRRKVITTVNQLFLGPVYLDGTDSLLTMQSKTVRNLSFYEGLHVAPMPFNLGSFVVQLAWSKAFDKHPAHVWIREQIVDICSSLQH